GVVAYPTGLGKKIFGVLAGTAIIFAINLIRVITLFYLSAYYPSLFDEAHLYIWQFAIIIIGGLLWLIWYDKVVQRHAATPAV
ncbi:MAG: archaeosortase B, partial [bacterium]